MRACFAALKWLPGGYAMCLGKNMIKLISEMNSLTIKTWVEAIKLCFYIPQLVFYSTTHVKQCNQSKFRCPKMVPWGLCNVFGKK